MNGAPFPFDRAVLDDSGFLSAWNVATGELRGLKFDWHAMDWIKKP